MNRQRATFTVEIDLDMVPGAFHTAEDTEKRLQSLLLSDVPHYNPVVTLTRDPRPKFCNFCETDHAKHEPHACICGHSIRDHKVEDGIDHCIGDDDGVECGCNFFDNERK